MESKDECSLVVEDIKADTLERSTAARNHADAFDTANLGRDGFKRHAALRLDRS